jgi:hypothetical protein
MGAVVDALACAGSRSRWRAPVAEVSSRLLERRAVPTKVSCFIENPHGTGSYRLKPNFRLRTVVEGTPVIIETNSEGMPWKEVTREKHLA